MTSTDELEAKNARVPRFLGVFADDQLPDLQAKLDQLTRGPNLTGMKRNLGYSAIINYSKLTDPRGGTHWVAFGNLRGEGPSLYFDSFGFAPDHDDVILSVGTRFRDFLLKNSGNGQVDSNQFDLQAAVSDTCGEWASFFIWAGSLPRLSPRSDQPRFVAPWDRFQFVRAISKSREPSRGLLAGFEKNDDVAKSNDAIVRQWAGIVNPALHNGGPGL